MLDSWQWDRDLQSAVRIRLCKNLELESNDWKASKRLSVPTAFNLAEGLNYVGRGGIK
jgi:hypothetical protein